MQLSTLPDIVGSGATVQLSSGTQQARQLTVCAIGGAARIGDASTAVAQGVECPEGVPVTFRSSSADRIDTFQLNQIYAYVPNSTTLTISYGL